MSNQLFTNLLKNHNLDLYIKLGHKTIKTKVKTVEMEPNLMFIPENILKDFCLPVQSYKFQAFFQPDLSTLKLGPVIGLLTDFPSNQEGTPFWLFTLLRGASSWNFRGWRVFLCFFI